MRWPWQKKVSNDKAERKISPPISGRSGWFAEVQAHPTKPGWYTFFVYHGNIKWSQPGGAPWLIHALSFRDAEDRARQVAQKLKRREEEKAQGPRIVQI